MNCIVIDDEPLALDILVNYCSKVKGVDLKKTFTKTSEALRYMEKFPVDLIFLDIQMPDISGIDFYKLLAEPKMVIFTTAHSEYAVEGFNLQAADYLLKPFSFARFEQAVNNAIEYFNFKNSRGEKTNSCLLVRSEYKLMKIQFDDILYIEGLGDYVKIFTDQPKPVISHTSMKSVECKLPDKNFTRVHRSFIVNTSRVIALSNNTIVINNIKIPVGVSYRERVHQLFS
jgi:DNA-binding LytR/AlgR family response regulator